MSNSPWNLDEAGEIMFYETNWYPVCKTSKFRQRVYIDELFHKSIYFYNYGKHSMKFRNKHQL